MINVNGNQIEIEVSGTVFVQTLGVNNVAEIVEFAKSQNTSSPNSWVDFADSSIVGSGNRFVLTIVDANGNVADETFNRATLDMIANHMSSLI